MRVAFYAPMKAPDDPKPSGDRMMARLLIKALDAAEASTVQPFAYLQLGFASALGVGLFGETVDAATLLGAALVVGAGLFTLRRERAARGGG